MRIGDRVYGVYGVDNRNTARGHHTWLVKKAMVLSHYKVVSKQVLPYLVHVSLPSITPGVYQRH